MNSLTEQLSRPSGAVRHLLKAEAVKWADEMRHDIEAGWRRSLRASCADVAFIVGGHMNKFATLSTGARLEYAESGPGGGTPIVFLHGVTDSWRSFERVLPLLPPSVHAFAVSQRGHGESTRPQTGYRLTDMSDDLDAFLDVVGAERAVVVGHSWGASVAQRFAVDHQDRVCALVLVGAFANVYHEPSLTDFFNSVLTGLADPIDRTFVRAWQLGTLAHRMPADHLESVISETLKVPARVWKAAFAGFLETPDFSARLRDVRVPTLMLWGDRDVFSNREAQDRLLDLIPGARLAVYERSGHALHWEDPLRFTRDLMAFLSERLTTGEPTPHEHCVVAAV